jgi:hypothetical protein
MSKRNAAKSPLERLATFLWIPFVCVYIYFFAIAFKWMAINHEEITTMLMPLMFLMPIFVLIGMYEIIRHFIRKEKE